MLVDQYILIFGNQTLFAVEQIDQSKLERSPDSQVAHLPLPPALLQHQMSSGQEYLTHLACGERFVVICTNHNRLFGIGDSISCEFLSKGAESNSTEDWVEIDWGDDLSRILVGGDLNPNRITRLVCGGYCVYVVINDRWVFSRGSNSGGQLGIGEEMIGKRDYFTPVYEFMNRSNGCDRRLSRITHMKASPCHTCIVVDRRKIFMTGSNNSGQLGAIDCVVPQPTFSRVTSLILDDGELIEDIGLGRFHTVVLTTRGRLFTVGGNDNGELADGTRASRCLWYQVDVPFPISELFVDEMANRTIVISSDNSQILGAGSILYEYYCNMSPLNIPDKNTSYSRLELQGSKDFLYVIYDRSVVHRLDSLNRESIVDLSSMRMTITHMETGFNFMAAVISPQKHPTFSLLVDRLRDHKLSDISFSFS